MRRRQFPYSKRDCETAKPSAGAGVRIENGRWMTSKQSEEHLWMGRRDLRRMNAGSFILPERGRSTVFIPIGQVDALGPEMLKFVAHPIRRARVVVAPENFIGMPES
jgi:hypothetical protein